MEEELRLHLEMLADDLQPPRPLAAREAMRQAQLQAGGVAQAMEQRRDQRGLPWLAGSACRTYGSAPALLRRTPGVHRWWRSSR